MSTKTTKEDWPRPYKGNKFRDNHEHIFGKNGIQHAIRHDNMDDQRIGQVRDGHRYIGGGCSQRCRCGYEERDDA